MQETPKPYATRKQNNLARPPVNLHIDDTEETSDTAKTSGFKVTLNARDQRASQAPSDEQETTASNVTSQDRNEADLKNETSPASSTDARETVEILEWTETNVSNNESQARDTNEPSPSADAPDSVWMTDARDAIEARTSSDEQKTPLPLEARAYNEAPHTSEPQAFVETSYAPRTTAASDAPSMSGLLTTPLMAIVTAVAVLAAAWSYSTLETTRAQLTAATEAKAAVDRALADAQGRLSAAENALAGVKAALTSSPAAVKKAPAPVAPAKEAP
ncbi:MAG: hypothetical protein CTY31_03545 [Hyphomicrobium sp.]|nr:MAG: hypothetical protein CTY39_07880 [Hyphomicrobium sp.]PPD01818.1 MAG: hypothetical protein CTY31_03545 [Hyphomicrobium sp.]